MMRAAYLYIMANRRNGTLYIGSTSDLIRRVFEHKHKAFLGFTTKYNVQMLVYYEVHDTYSAAAQREKCLKKWRRQWKLDLIETINPTWRDLYNEEICL